MSVIRASFERILFFSLGLRRLVGPIGNLAFSIQPETPAYIFTAPVKPVPAAKVRLGLRLLNITG
jgi:hypothetical protein